MYFTTLILDYIFFALKDNTEQTVGYIVNIVYLILLIVVLFTFFNMSKNLY